MKMMDNGVVRDMTHEEETIHNAPCPAPWEDSIDDSEALKDKAAAYDIIVSGITEKETPKPLEIAKKIKEIVDKYYKG